MAEGEFADELLLGCLARTLRLWIVAVPLTPPGCRTRWQIQEHPCETLRDELSIDQSRRVVLGNDNVHYVWLSKAEP